MEEFLGISSKRLIAWIQLVLVVLLAAAVISLIFSPNANPDFPPLWGLKRVQEKAFLGFKSTPSEKFDYMTHLLDIRLDELENITNNKSYNYLLRASLRYSTLAGEITELVINNNMVDQVQATKEQFRDHKKVLNDLYVKYPKNTDNVEYKYLEDDINYLNIYLQKLDEMK